MDDTTIENPAFRPDVSPRSPGQDLESGDEGLLLPPHPHPHFSQRAPWLRAGVLGCADGLVSTSSLMLGVGGGSSSRHTMVLAGVAGLVGGALSMAVGEFISVSSQKDSEEADIEKERVEQAKGPEAQARELQELQWIYMDRGLERELARQVAVQLSEKDVIRAHARDELGIDLDELANPWKAAFSSAIAFVFGAGVPLLGSAFITNHTYRLISLVIVSTIALLAAGMTGAWLGGAGLLKPTGRVLIGGWLALGITYGAGRLIGGGTMA